MVAMHTNREGIAGQVMRLRKGERKNVDRDDSV